MLEFTKKLRKEKEVKMYKFNFYHTRPENFFYNNNEEQTKGLVGYLRGDFGKDGGQMSIK